MGKFQFSLDKALSRRARILLLVAASLIPTVYVAKNFDSSPHFSKMILFGLDSQAREIADVAALNPKRLTPEGYDGQYYAEIAVHPMLTDPDYKTSLKGPAYRARRILLPVMAYLLGFGQPRLILEMYALLNLGFWFALLLGMAHYLKAETFRDYLCIFAAVFTTGSMISVQRCLTDLPAATLLFYAAATAPSAASGMLALAVLARETSAIYLVRFAWPLPKTAKEWLVLAARSALIMLPLALWVAYVRHVFGNLDQPGGLLSLPFAGWARYMQSAWFNFTHVTWQVLASRPLLSWSEALHHPGREWSRWWEGLLPYLRDTTSQERVTFELLAPLSLLAEVCYFAIWRAPQSPYWRLGVIFSLLLICLPMSEEQIAYCRAVLPVTIAFNIELRQRRGWQFLLFFIAGNIGLMWGLRDTLAFCIFK